MRKFYFLLIFISLLFSSNLAMAKPLACPSPGLYTIGPTGNYISITQAIADLASCGGSLSGSYIFEFQGTYLSSVETFPITFPNLGATSANTITFRPATGATNLTITTNNDSATLILNGAKYIYFDGRSGGTGTTKNLTIENTSTSLVVQSVAGASSSGVNITLAGGATVTGLTVGMFVGVSPGAGLFAAGTKVATITDATHFSVTSAPIAALNAGTTVITAGYNNCGVKFINDATNNSISYCYIKSRNKSATSGTVFFSNTTGSTGNDNNTVDNCDIGGDASNTPLNAIYSDGSPTTAATYNSGNIISNNDIHDFYNGIASPSGVLLRVSSSWTFSGNSLYQTASRSLATNSIQFNGINITSTCTNNFQITNNYLGGTAPKAGGGTLTFTGSGQFLGFATSVAGATATITGNKVMNINFTSNGATSNFRPIGIFAGTVNCTNDTISNIQLTLNGVTLPFASMIQSGTGALSHSAINISNNVIKDVSLTSTTSPGLRAISFQGNPTVGYTVNNNFIDNFSSSANIGVIGIFASSGSGTCSILNNIINNLSQTGTLTGGGSYGIFTNSTSGISFTIQKNTLTNIASSSTYTTDPVASGIIVYSSGTTNNIDSNTISTIQATYNTSSIGIGASGIAIANASAGGNVLNNKIYNITNTSNNINSLIAGFKVVGGSWTVANNMISLSNGANTSATLIAGIYDNSGVTGTRNYFYNSVYIGGTGPSDSYGTAMLYNCGSGTAVIKNNIFVMARSGGTANFYAIANKTSNTANFTSNNNILNATSTAKIGLWGTTPVTHDKDFAAWKTATGGDNLSFSGEYIPFTNTALGDLHINTSDATLASAAYVSNIESRGAVVSITYDHDNGFRPGPTNSLKGGAIAPDIGADEVDLAYSGDNIWIGNTSTDWTTAANWTIGVPNSTRNAVIPDGTTFDPATVGANSAKNVIIGLGSSLTVSTTLSIAGVITNAGTFNAESGTIELNGTAAQAISGSIFTNRSINNLLISNAAGVNVSSTLNDTLNITGSISFGNVNNAVLNSGDNITLRSTASATARFADVTNAGANSGDTIIGKVIVERFLPMQNSSISRRWRLLATPLQLIGSPTINEAWQLGVANSNVSTPINPRPGYGTQITNGNTAAAVANGFDIGTTANPSIYYMNPGVSPTWQAPANTSLPIAGQEGYMIFSRGDRSIIINNQFVSAAPTTLPPKGNLKIGNITKSLVTGKQVIGNPYASAISFDKVLLNGATPNDAGHYFYYWDPKTDGSHNVGKFISVKNNGVGEPSAYTIAPSANASGIVDGTIESGAAIVINSSGAPNSMTFHETDKKTTSSTIGIASRPVAPTGVADLSRLYTNLYYVNATGAKIIADGVAGAYYPSYTNEVDNADVPKLISFNSKESISILREGKLLSIETRQTLSTKSDTTYYEMRNLDSRNYRLEFIAENFKTKYDIFLEDAATSTRVPLAFSVNSRTVYFDFIVSNDIPGSANVNRFKLILQPSPEAGPLPVLFSSIKANRINSTAFVNWKVENEVNIHHYEIERSADGINFTTIAETLLQTNNGNEYMYIDNNALTAISYYRIKSISNTGKVIYSSIVKLSTMGEDGMAAIYPSVINNGVMNIAFTHLPKGKYNIHVTDISGRSILKRSIMYSGGDMVTPVPLSKSLAGGKYWADLQYPDNTHKVFPILLQN